MTLGLSSCKCRRGRFFRRFKGSPAVKILQQEPGSIRSSLKTCDITTCCRSEGLILWADQTGRKPAPPPRCIDSSAVLWCWWEADWETMRQTHSDWLNLLPTDDDVTEVRLLLKKKPCQSRFLEDQLCAAAPPAGANAPHHLMGGATFWLLTALNLLKQPYPQSFERTTWTPPSCPGYSPSTSPPRRDVLEEEGTGSWGVTEYIYSVTLRH